MTENATPDHTDTATGTDPDAHYEQPGYEDKSLGQAVAQDQELADEAMRDADGDAAQAEKAFDERSHGPSDE